MNYKQARQLPSGKWHYTNCNNGLIYSLGYCRKNKCCPCRFNEVDNIDSCVVCEGTGSIPSEHYCNGHDTAEEACAHYRDFLLDYANYDVRDEHCLEKCEICGTWTHQIVSIDYYIYHRLCEQHCNRDGLAQVAKQIHQSMGT
mgnify:CR=1 FL=1